MAAERLVELDDGRYAYNLRKRWRDGTAVVYFDPMTLMQRLAALIPRPHANLVRYFGVFAPASKFRRRVVPPGPPAEIDPDPKADLPERRSRYIAWAVLLRRVFGPTAWPLDCPACGGTMLILAAIRDAAAIHAILSHLGLPTTPPPLAPARGPPY